MLNEPMHIALNPQETRLYIADSSSIRVINLQNDTIYRVAGMGPKDTAGFYGDGGQATAALLNRPTSVYVDSAGNMYIADGFNYCIRKVNTSGIITTIASNPALGYLGYGYTGDGNSATNAQFNYPGDITMDPSTGNIYIADVNNDAIRMINVFGYITTVAGCHVRGFNGDNKLATVTKLYAPTAINIHKGRLYFSDSGNARIRSMNLVPSLVPTTTSVHEDVQLWPNPNEGSFAVSGSIYSEKGTAALKVVDITGRELYSGQVTVANGEFRGRIELGKNLPAGFYMVKVISESDQAVVRFVKQ
jgi:sugar lactone lactonase YvrE